MNAGEYLKSLMDAGFIQAAINGKLEVRYPLKDWRNWDESVTVLFDPSWEKRIKPEPREWWITWCPNDGPQARVFYKQPIKQCPECEIVHVREVFEPILAC
jgi:hypothetical protein